jgi:hypothetical protein
MALSMHTLQTIRQRRVRVGTAIERVPGKAPRWSVVITRDNDDCVVLAATGYEYPTYQAALAAGHEIVAQVRGLTDAELAALAAAVH